MERKIGEIFNLNGEWYQCIENDSCGECSLFTTECGSGTKSDLADKVVGQCSKVRRTDNKHVIFKKLKKIGEPYFNGQYVEVLQEYKYYIPPITPDLRIHIIKLGIVGIEIKQNKEDMEEKNLKPFDLQKAREGKPVCTRDGRKARIICFDLQSIEKTPIVAAVQLTNKQEVIANYYENGRQFINGISELDLMMPPEKKEGWVNVYKHNLYDTESEAKRAHVKEGYIDTIKIEWEE